MEQLILRQAAIDALRTCYDTETISMDNGDEYINYGDAVGEIEQLPPIQPEITHEQAIDYLHSTGWMQEHDRQMMLDGVRKLTIQPEPHWIPVTERPPEIGESVMICDAYGDICIGHRTQCGYYYPDFCEDKIKDVRAWCELPEPYKGVTT